MTHTITCANAECGRRATMTRRDARFCSSGCRGRMAEARKAAERDAERASARAALDAALIAGDIAAARTAADRLAGAA